MSDLSDAALLADDMDAVKPARRLRATLPARQAGTQLGEAGSRLYEVTLDECCGCLARIIVHLPEFEPRAAAETLGRLTGLADQVAAVLVRLPARSLTAPEGRSDDAEFTRRYLASLSENLDSLEFFGVRFERFTRPQTTLSVAYINVNASAEGGPPGRAGARADRRLARRAPRGRGRPGGGRARRPPADARARGGRRRQEHAAALARRHGRAARSPASWRTGTDASRSWSSCAATRAVRCPAPRSTWTTRPRTSPG
ncbi:hypothetical protein GCM10010191_30400 [Actinomadura vinacea]|uniref:NACHT N-terminal Helical domain-containing protein n=1 Tax=Actinomadura vinacea TaxID=115336 RepID=A0ABN3J098_9ACTN